MLISTFYAQVLGFCALLPLVSSVRAHGQDSSGAGATIDAGQAISVLQTADHKNDQTLSAESHGDLPDAPHPVLRSVHPIRLPDFNRAIYYKNKVEVLLESGWLPNNIPFVFDFLVASAYATWPLHYTLQPNILSIRWHLDNIWGWKFLRGNTDFTFSGAYTGISRGAETRYFAFNYGIRRNVIPRRWRIVPYVEGRGGIGNINAKGPYGVEYAQGQDMTFTPVVGSGARYNFGPKYGISAGMTYMHVSNLYLSELRDEGFGINVNGPIVGVYMRLCKPKAQLRRLKQ
jgi:hypothetical protein